MGEVDALVGVGNVDNVGLVGGQLVFSERILQGPVFA